MTRLRSGNALISALLTIAVLSIMVISFCFEARQQGAINIYVRERNRIMRVIDAGQAIGEIVMLKYSEVADWSEDQDNEKLLDDDRWVLFKQDLKQSGRCKIGPLLLDDERDKDGEFINTSTVTIEIESANENGKININSLYAGGGDANYQERWWMIFRDHNIPEELSTPKDGIIKLWNILIASWNDWRDSDSDVTNFENEEAGAENKWYEDYEKENDLDKEEYMEYRRRPRNGPIPDVHELENLRGWREYPQVLTGGVINPWEHKDDQISVKGVLDVLCADGSSKININDCRNVGVLVTVPGIYEEPEEDDSLEDARINAQAILDALETQPEYEVDETRSWWPFKDFSDLQQRLADTDGEVGPEASNYLQFKAEDFTIRITGESMGMTHSVEAKCYIKDGKVRYYKWCENPIMTAGRDK